MQPTKTSFFEFGLATAGAFTLSLVSKMNHFILILLVASFGLSAHAADTFTYRPVHNSNTFDSLFSEELNTIAYVPTYILRIEDETATLTSSSRSDKAVKFSVRKKDNFLILSLSEEHPKYELRKLGLFALYQDDHGAIHWDGRVFKKEKD